ncbi:MAG: PAS domain-containing protein, partial [Bacteroidia bacterium]
FPLFDHDNIIYAIGGIATDITERKLNEREIRLRADHIIDLFNNAPCAYHSVNNQGIITEINDTELKWLGYTREEVINKMHILQILADDGKKLFDYYFPKVKQGKIDTLTNVELKMKRKDGTLFLVESNITMQFDEEGNFVSTRSSFFDISMRKHAESLISQN